jgi:hypothetical protein
MLDFSMMKTIYLITLLILMLVVALIYGGVRIGAIAWPYVVITDYEIYSIHGQTVREGPDDVWIVPGFDTKKRAIIPGVLYYKTIRNEFNLHIRSTGDTGLANKPKSIILNHLSLKRSNGSVESIIDGREAIAHRTYQTENGWTIISSFSNTLDSFTLTATGHIEYLDGTLANFSLISPWMFAGDVKVSTEHLYRGE